MTVLIQLCHLKLAFIGLAEAEQSSIINSEIYKNSIDKYTLEKQ